MAQRGGTCNAPPPFHDPKRRGGGALAKVRESAVGWVGAVRTKIYRPGALEALANDGGHPVRQGRKFPRGPRPRPPKGVRRPAAALDPPSQHAAGRSVPPPFHDLKRGGGGALAKV